MSRGVIADHRDIEGVDDVVRIEGIVVGAMKGIHRIAAEALIKTDGAGQILLSGASAV